MVRRISEKDFPPEINNIIHRLDGEDEWEAELKENQEAKTSREASVAGAVAASTDGIRDN